MIAVLTMSLECMPHIGERPHSAFQLQHEGEEAAIFLHAPFRHHNVKRPRNLVRKLQTVQRGGF